VLAGTALAWAEGPGPRWGVVAAVLAAAVLIQAGTNLHNDVEDFERGGDDRTTRVGPPRATAEGWLTPAQVRAAAYGCFATAFLAGLYLVWVGGWPILALGVASIAAGIAYSGGPRPIAYTPLGELFVWVFFGLAAVAGTYYLQAGRLDPAAWWAGAALGLPAAAVLVVNNFRDRDNDRRAGRRTSAVLLGRRSSLLLYGALMLGPFPLLAALGPSASWPAALLPLAALPRGIGLARRLARTPPGRALNPLLGATARYQLWLAGLLAAGLALGEMDP
jgi:1,4-dihydroxy-2-naphthoate octaprenyltransferase